MQAEASRATGCMDGILGRSPLRLRQAISEDPGPVKKRRQCARPGISTNSRQKPENRSVMAIELLE